MFTVKWIADNGAEMLYCARDVSFTPGGPITPSPIFPDELVFAAGGAVENVWDGRVPLRFDRDYGDSVSLRAAKIEPGLFATCVAEGLFRLGGTPFKIITCDPRDHKARVSFYITGRVDGDSHCVLDNGRVYVMNANGKTIADYVLSTKEFPHGLAPRQAA